MLPRTLTSSIVPALLTFGFVIANSSHADTVTQNSLITATNSDYLLWEGEWFDRVTAPGTNPLWSVNFDPPAGSSGNKTIIAPGFNDTGGVNNNFLIYRFQLPVGASVGDYFFYAFRTGGAGDSIFAPPSFNADPFQTPAFPGPGGNAGNRWNSIADNTWNQLGRVGDYPATGYFATNNYTYQVAGGDIGNVLEFRIEAREAGAQFDRFALHKTDLLSAAQLNALTLSNVTIANPVQPPAFQIPIGAPQGGFGFFGIREKINNGNMDNQDNARASLANATGTTHDYTAPVLNIQDSGGAGNFGGDSPFGVTTAGVGPARGSVDHIAMFVSGTIRVPTAGVYTFGVNSDDGFTVLIPGANFTNPVGAGTTLKSFAQGTALTFFPGRGTADSLGQVTLPAGDHTLYMTYHEGGGGAAVELFAAEGAQTSFNSGFALVGAQPSVSPAKKLVTVGTWDYVRINGSTSLADAIARYNDNAPTGDFLRTVEPTVAFDDPGAGSNTGGHTPVRPFPGDTAANEDNFGGAGRVTLTIAPGDVGRYTFLVYSDDSERFRILDSTGTPVPLMGFAGGAGVFGTDTNGDTINDAFQTTGCCEDALGKYDLVAGTYTMEAIFNEQGGGAGFFVYGAMGDFNAFDANAFQLAGENINQPPTPIPGGLQLVPEPTSAALCAFASVFALGLRRRRK